MPEVVTEPSRARKISWKLNVFSNQVVYECLWDLLGNNDLTNSGCLHVVFAEV
jgi:hypothetical protein